MDPLDTVTPLILTFNEEANIRRSLQSLQWASRIVVVDSYSTDGTRSILAESPVVEVFSRAFDNHSAQWNHGLEQVESEWVLALDADYRLPKTFVSELRELMTNPRADGYYARFKYCILGRRLRASLYPPRIVLFRTAHGRYLQDGHTQLLDLEGSADELRSSIEHDDRKPLRRWLQDQERYAELEAAKLLGTPRGGLPLTDRIRRTGILGPALTLLYCLLLKNLLFDGRAGWYYTLQRTYAELLLVLKIWDLRLRSEIRAERVEELKDREATPPAMSKDS